MAFSDELAAFKQFGPQASATVPASAADPALSLIGGSGGEKFATATAPSGKPKPANPGAASSTGMMGMLSKMLGGIGGGATDPTGADSDSETEGGGAVTDTPDDTPDFDAG